MVPSQSDREAKRKWGLGNWTGGDVDTEDEADIDDIDPGSVTGSEEEEDESKNGYDTKIGGRGRKWRRGVDRRSAKRPEVRRGRAIEEGDGTASEDDGVERDGTAAEENDAEYVVDAEVEGAVADNDVEADHR